VGPRISSRGGGNVTAWRLMAAGFDWNILMPCRIGKLAGFHLKKLAFFAISSPYLENFLKYPYKDGRLFPLLDRSEEVSFKSARDLSPCTFFSIEIN
jgi:hypothetical protein